MVELQRANIVREVYVQIQSHGIAGEHWEGKTDLWEVSAEKIYIS